MKRHRKLIVVFGQLFGMLSMCFLWCSTSATAAEAQTTESDFAYVAEFASITFNQKAYLAEAGLDDLWVSAQVLDASLKELRTIESRQTNELGEAANDIARTLPLMHKVYLALKAENFNELPLAMLTQLMAQTAFQRDLRKYEIQSQAAGLRLVEFLRIKSQATASDGAFTCTPTQATADCVNRTGKDLRNCLISVTGLNIVGDQIHIVAFFDEWRNGQEVNIWSGSRYSFGPCTDMEIEVLTCDQRFEKQTFSFPHRIREACEFACRGAEKTLQDDKFSAAVEQAGKLRAIVRRRSVSGFDERLNRIQQLAERGTALLAQRSEWVEYFREYNKLQGEYRNGRDRAKVGCLVTHTDEETGYIRMECYVIDGRSRITFRVYGRIDIIPEEDTMTVSLTKRSRRTASGSSELSLEKRGRTVIGRDDDGGRISFRPVRS